MVITDFKEKLFQVIQKVMDKYTTIGKYRATSFNSQYIKNIRNEDGNND